MQAISFLLPREIGSLGGSFSKERMRKRSYLFPPRRSPRICLIPRHLINSSTERALENFHIIYQFEGGNRKQKICLFSFASLLSLLQPSFRPTVLPSSPREGKDGGAGRGGGGQPSAHCLPKPNYRIHC